MSCSLLRPLPAMLLMGVAACGSSTDEGSGQSAPPADITIPVNASVVGAVAFKPDTLTVSFATKHRISWGNRDGGGVYGASGTAHHIIGDGGTFDSGVLAAGKNFGFTFDSAGTYTYHCSIHPTMVGRIVITP